MFTIIIIEILDVLILNRFEFNWFKSSTSFFFKWCDWFIVILKLHLKIIRINSHTIVVTFIFNLIYVIYVISNK